MRWAPACVAAILATTVWAGCSGPVLPAIPARLESFRAMYGYSDVAVTFNITFDGPFDFLASDTTRHPGYRLVTDHGFHPKKPQPGVIQVPVRDTKVLDGTLQVVRRSHTCSMSSSSCEASSIWWDGRESQWYVRDPSLGPGIIRTDTNHTVQGPEGPATYWETTIAEYDSLPAPVRITHIDRWAGRTYAIERRSYEAGEALPSIAPWPSAHVPGNGPWVNPLFPGADQDLLQVGASPLAAFQRLAEIRPDVAAAMATGGCVVGFDADVHDPAAGAMRETRMTFVVQDAEGATMAPAIRWHEVAPTVWVLSPLVLDTAAPPAKRTCAEQAATPWPAVSVADLVETWSSWHPDADDRLEDLTVGLRVWGDSRGRCCSQLPGTLPIQYHGNARSVSFDLQGVGYTYVQAAANVTFDSAGRT